MHKLTANTDGLTEVAASQQGSTDLETRAEQIATAAMGELPVPNVLLYCILCELKSYMRLAACTIMFDNGIEILTC